MRADRSLVASLTSLALVLQVPLPALAAGSGFGPDSNDSVARRCDVFSSVFDRQYDGPRMALDDSSVAEALQVCAQAAEARPARARYVYLYGTALLAAKRYAEAARQFEAARRAGNPWGADSLAWLAAQGWGEPQDNAKAARLFRESGDAGLPIADFGLAALYESGAGVPRDPQEAARLYRRAAEGGIASAYARLMGLALAATPPNPVEIAHWAQLAAEHGDARARLELARLLIAGTGVPADHRAAYAWALEAAKADLVPAQVLVGSMAYDGDGVARNHAEAARWFRKAAEHGDTFAMFQLGMLLRNGDGIARSEADAVRWFRQAADKGSVESEESLGEGYMHGLGSGGPDYRAAVYWLERAASKGDGYAQLNLGSLYADGKGVQRDMRRAQSLFVKASLSRDPRVARKANENLSAMLHQSRPGSGGDDSTAVVGVALVGLALLWAFSGSDNPGSAPGPKADDRDRVMDGVLCGMRGGTQDVWGSCNR